RSIPTSMAVYKLDGAWPEGPGYWIYGTNFNSLMISALDTALGNDFGLSKAKGFDKAGNFLMHIIQPGGKRCFNYADGGRGMNIASAMFFLARKFDRPVYAWFERQRMLRRIERHKKQHSEYRMRYADSSRLYAMEIAWFDDRGTVAGLDKQPLDILFRGIVPIVAMRSAWNDAGALYVGFKGGINTISHGHLDIGSFVLESDGVDWAIDIGADHYSLPGYWDKKENGQRWKYYRLGSKSHNTLVIDGKLQRVSDKQNKIISFLSTPDRAHAVLDMSNTYKGQAKKVLRGVAMLDRRAVLIQDEITAPAGEVRWGMLTEAKITLDGAKATLTKDGKTLSAEILSPAGARFKIVTPPKPGKKERPHPKNLSMLAVFVKPTGNGKQPMNITVLLKPTGPRWDELSLPKLRPLSEWENTAK
ncbi:MAG: heparinase II/III-family protein, partial [Phycisphaerae bacterium]|nr:heparinase II/III-family protein [Phycisphaerae bacterium]